MPRGSRSKAELRLAVVYTLLYFRQFAAFKATPHEDEAVEKFTEKW